MTTREDVVRKMIELAGTTLINTGQFLPLSALWIMKRPDTLEVRKEPGMLSLPSPKTQGEVEPWFRELERQAIDLDAVAAGLVLELSGDGQRYLVAQLEERGQPTRLWKALIDDSDEMPQLGRMVPDAAGTSTMTLLPPDPTKVN